MERFFVFFSSRRRHTRFDCDWSSDVCSSDLTEVVRRLFDQIGARYADRHGGYTRIIHAGVRRGDGAPVVYLELVDRPETPPDGKDKKGEKKERPSKGEGKAQAESGGKRKKKEKAAAASA